METEVETIIAQLCGCIDTGTLSKYGKNSRVEDVKKRKKDTKYPLLNQITEVDYEQFGGMVAKFKDVY